MSSESLLEDVCRICREGSEGGPLISNCNCKGTMGFVHLACLTRWLTEAKRKTCELCGKEFKLKQELRYNKFESLVVWLFATKGDDRGIDTFSTVVELLYITCLLPSGLVTIYYCVVYAEFFNMEESNGSLAFQWPTISVVLMAFVLSGFLFCCIYLTIDDLLGVWYLWWQRQVYLVILPDS